MADYTMWYRVGTVALTKNSKIVTGTGTYWLAAGLHPGDIFSVDCVTEYEVATIDSNTQITLKTVYTGDSTSESAYRIIRNFTAAMSAETAANTAALLNDFRRYVDADMQSIHGKSAYQIACDKGYVGTESEWVQSLHAPDGKSAYEVAVENGFSGTESEWLESLIGAGQWDTLDARTQPLLWNWKNSIARGQNLGETYNNNALFSTVRLGDYYTMNGKRLIVAGFNYCRQTGYDTVTFVGQTASQPRNSEEQDNSVTYGNSYWYTEYLPTYIAELEAFFGDRLNTYPIYAVGSFSGTSDIAGPASYVELSSKAHMITHSMITGFSPALAKSPLDWENFPRYSYPQLPLYRITGHPHLILTADGENYGYLVGVVREAIYYRASKHSTTPKLAVFHVCKILNPN